MRPLKIVYEDDWYIVIDKPTGILVTPSANKDLDSLTDRVNAELAKRGLTVKAHPCHRLDRETSGLVIFAKGKMAQSKMMDEFREKKVEKKYLAFVHGKLAQKKALIKKQIWLEKKKNWQMAITRYQVREERRDFSVVEVEPITGRTNQIRLHFKQLHHPILGERKFAFARDFSLKFKRLALHAEKISFLHPFSKEKISLYSPLPEEMENFLQSLGRHPRASARGGMHGCLGREPMK
jgi:23S rRNA pseudouridine1911/1915/1917 synthase